MPFTPTRFDDVSIVQEFTRHAISGATLIRSGCQV
jgi:hypothetical protein